MADKLRGGSTVAGYPILHTGNLDLIQLESLIDETIVTINDAQTITGAKTFSNIVDINNNLLVDGTNISLDSTDTSNFTMTADNSSNKTLTISASNSGSGTGDISITADTITLTGTVVGDNNTEYSTFTSTVDGLVPAPTETPAGNYLKYDGTWETPTDNNYYLSEVDTSTLSSVSFTITNGSNVTGVDFSPTLSDIGGVGNWKLFYSNGSGDVVELDMPSNSTDFLRGNGASAAPSWETPAYIANTNTATHADGIMDGSNSGTEVSYDPYTRITTDSGGGTNDVNNSSNDGVLYTGTIDPTDTTRLNYNGAFHSTTVKTTKVEVETWKIEKDGSTNALKFIY